MTLIKTPQNMMISGELPPTWDGNKSRAKSRFMAGFNTGQRHAHPDKAAFGGRPPHFDLLGSNWSADYIAGYKFGVQERRAGNIVDNESCGRRIEETWGWYAGGAGPPDVVLP